MSGYAINDDGRNVHWLVCRKCLVAWAPDDIPAEHVHMDGPDDGPMWRCDGAMVELEPTTE